MKKLVLFDFDGTLIQSDSGLGFVKHHFGQLKVWQMLIRLPFFRVRGGDSIEDRNKTKEKVIHWLFAGKEEKVLRSSGSIFAQNLASHDLNPKLQQDFQNHIDDPDSTVVIVSASLDLWIEAFASIYKIQYLCTQMEYIDGKATGSIIGENCNYQEKRMRIEAAYNLKEYDEIIAYGDSKGDEAMFELADTVNRV